MELKMREVTLELVSSKTDQPGRELRNVGGKLYTGKMMLGPSVGKSFCFYRDDGAYMHTSDVKMIEYKENDELILTTQNSVYSLKIGKPLSE